MTSILDSHYLELCKTPSDINEHLPVLYDYATRCSTIVECGVRSVVSSYAFANALKSNPDARLFQVDLNWHDNIKAFQRHCASEGLRTSFYGMSDLECPLEKTDMLFIDTWHVYGHLKRELARWHSHVDKYIIMHDTLIDAERGETLRVGWDPVRQSKDTGIPVDEICKGLQPAIDEFLGEHPEWVVHAHYPNNNGLTILSRV
jgi:hypothetical protein